MESFNRVFECITGLDSVRKVDLKRNDILASIRNFVHLYAKTSSEVIHSSNFGIKRLSNSLQILVSSKVEMGLKLIV